MNIKELIVNRESCRAYSDKAVDQDLLVKIVDIARMAPSAANTQPWKAYATVDPVKVKRLAEGIGPMNRNVFASQVKAFVVMTELQPEEPWTPSTPYSHYYRDFDCGIAATHICFAATELGLSTCMIGWYDDAIIKEVCGYDDSEKAILIFTVGYAADDKLRDKTRRSLDEVLTIL